MNSGPATADITIYKGQRVIQPLRKLDAAGAPEDITGHTYVFTTRRSYESAAVVQQAVDITDAASGLYQIDLAHTTTVALVAGNYPFDVTRTDAGSEGPVLLGTLIVKQEVHYP